MRRAIVLVALMVMGLAEMAWAAMPLAGASLRTVEAGGPPIRFYVTIEGQKTGKIAGEIAAGPHKDQLAGLAYSHSIVSPRDIQSGLPTGQRMHKPVVFTRERGAASPLLFNVLCTNENLKTVRFDFVQAGAGGAEEVYLTIILTNANIASLDTRVPLAGDTDKPRDYEEIALTYQKIQITAKGGTTATDDWMARP